MEKIISADNSSFKKIKKLKQKKYREEFELFLAEGIKFLDFSVTPEYIIIREDIVDSLEEKIEKFNCKKIILENRFFSELSSQEHSQGLILVYKTNFGSLEEINKNIVVLDRVTDPGNLGTIIRLCDAAGFKDILMSKGTVDCYNEKVVRSSMGSIFSMNLIYMEEEDILEFLEKKQYKTFVTALAETSIEYTEIKPSEKNAIVFGNEGQGASSNFLNFANEKVIIPIYGTAESLNVAVASGIVMYKMRELLNREK